MVDALSLSHPTGWVSVVTRFDGLMFTFGDGSLVQHGMSLKGGEHFQRGMSLKGGKGIDHLKDGDRYERTRVGWAEQGEAQHLATFRGKGRG